MDFNPDNMLKRFWELTAKYDKAMAKIAPLHEKLSSDTITLKEERKIREQIMQHKEGLYELEMERAALARALGGKTGSSDA